MMLREPTSKPVPSQGAWIFTGKPATASVTPSCMKLMLIDVSPRATALMGPTPERVYWLTFRCSWRK